MRATHIKLSQTVNGVFTNVPYPIQKMIAGISNEILFLERKFEQLIECIMACVQST